MKNLYQVSIYHTINRRGDIEPISDDAYRFIEGFQEAKKEAKEWEEAGFKCFVDKMGAFAILCELEPINCDMLNSDDFENAYTYYTREPITNWLNKKYQKILQDRLNDIIKCNNSAFKPR